MAVDPIVQILVEAASIGRDIRRHRDAQAQHDDDQPAPTMTCHDDDAPDAAQTARQDA